MPDAHLSPSFPSPGGRYTIETDSVPMRMSHEVVLPLVRDLATGEVLADGRDTLWSVDTVEWTSDAVAVMTCRHYPDGQASVVATVDCDRRTVSVGTSAPRPLADWAHALDQTTPAAGSADRLVNVLERLVRALETSPRLGIAGQSPDEVREAASLVLYAPGGPKEHEVSQLFRPTGDVHDVAIANGWSDVFLDLASVAEEHLDPRDAREGPRLTRRETQPVPGRVVPQSVRRVRSTAVPLWVPLLGLAATSVLAMGWLGGGQAMLGAAAVLLALSLPFLVAVGRFMLDPVGTLLHGPQRVRTRIRRALSTPRSRIVLISIVALGVWLLIAGGGAMLDGLTERQGR